MKKVDSTASLQASAGERPALMTDELFVSSPSSNIHPFAELC
jgi:hypothetical protein